MLYMQSHKAKTNKNQKKWKSKKHQNGDRTHTQTPAYTRKTSKHDQDTLSYLLLLLNSRVRGEPGIPLFGQTSKEIPINTNHTYFAHESLPNLAYSYLSSSATIFTPQLLHSPTDPR